MIRALSSLIAVALIGSCGARDGVEIARIGDAPMTTGTPLRGVGLDATRLVSVLTDRARLHGQAVDGITLIDDQVVLTDRPLAEQRVVGLSLTGRLSDEREVELIVVGAVSADTVHRYRLLARDDFGNFTSVCGGAGYGVFERVGHGLTFHCPAGS